MLPVTESLVFAAVIGGKLVVANDPAEVTADD